MDDELYRENIIDHYKYPRNKGVFTDCDIIERGRNVTCGDDLVLYVAIERGTIVRVMFDGNGCALSTAATSMLIERVLGMSVHVVRALVPNDVYALLGISITLGRENCALLSLRTLQNSIKKYEQT